MGRHRSTLGKTRFPANLAYRWTAPNRVFLLLIAAASALGNAAFNPDKAITTCVEVASCVLVETVSKNSEGEKTGLAEGDVIVGWTRGDANGEIRSPFDLSEVETEQEPRGQVTLEGFRGAVQQRWAMGPFQWGIATRPNLPESVLTIYREGEELAKAGNLKDAAERWRTIIERVQKDKCTWLNSWFFFHAADALASMRQWKESDVLYREAVERIAESDPPVKAQLLRAWAGTFEQRRDWSAVETYQKQALAESRKLEAENLGIAKSLGALDSASYGRGDLAKSEEYCRQALAIRNKLAPGSLDAAASLNHLGNIADDRGDHAKAEEYYRLSLAIKEKVNPYSLDVAESLNNIAAVADERGDLAESEEYHLRALAIRQKLAPGSPDVAMSLNNLGNVADDRGDLVKAEEYYRQSLAIKEKLQPDSAKVALTLGNLGNVAGERGDLGRADGYFRQALAILDRLDPGSLYVAGLLNNLAIVAHERGDLTKAEEYDRQALAITKTLAPFSEGAGTSLNNLGDVAYSRGDLGNAGKFYSQALEIRTKLAPHGHDVAESLRDVGLVAHDSGDLAKAGDYYGQALEIERKLAPDSVKCAESLAAMAGILRQRQQPEEAAKLYAGAIDVFDRQLTHLGGSNEARAGFRAKHANYYSDYAGLLLEQKKPELAFEVMERSRARTLLETLAEAHVDIRQGVDSGVVAKERLLQATLTAKTNRKISLLEGDYTPEQLAAVNKELTEVLSQYQELEGQIRSGSPKYSALTQPKTLGSAEVQQQLLDADTVLLDYALAIEHSFVFVVTATSLDSYELPKGAEIEKAAHHVYDLLTSRNRWVESETSAQRKARLTSDEAEYEKTASALSEMVLGPVAQHLEGKRLLIVADGALQYIPFGVLPVPAGDRSSKGFVPLVAEHEIVNLPSASVLALLRQQAKERETQPTKEVAILADPVFDKSDPRVGKAKEVMLAAEKDPIAEPVPSSAEHLTRSLEDVSGTRQAGAGLSRLAFSRREAAAIMAVTKPGGGMEALDFQASRETATSKDLSQYRIVHFATHGLLDNEHPELSGLVLSLVGPDGKARDGFLDLEDVYNLNLPSDLVVLSACETGLGKEIGGEGLVGLTRGFMYAGASRVVASLWQVDDVATAELMSEFYKAMLQQGMRPAAALRQAEVAMWKQKRWSDPYYWAAFTLQGEWK
jgi:CHAT domain-containing protein/Tfp pilus assembly protein PilF